MYLHFRLLLLLTAFSVIVACKAKTDSADTRETSAETAPALPSLTREDIAELHARTDKVDIIFYEHPVSVSQDDGASAKNTVLYIAPTPPATGVTCPAVARLSWLSDGAFIKEANVHIDAQCAYLVFVEKEQPVAMNAMDPVGSEFFRSIIQQATQRMGQ